MFIAVLHMGVTLFDRFHPKAKSLRGIIYECKTQQPDAGRGEMLQLMGSNPGKNIYTISGERPCVRPSGRYLFNNGLPREKGVTNVTTCDQGTFCDQV